MRQHRTLAFFAALLVGVLLAGCTTTPPEPAHTADFTKPGAAADMVGQLMAQAGSTRVVRVRLTATEAEICVVSGTTVTTYAWRDNQVSTVDSDVEYVGQAVFDPRTFDLDNLGDLFARAAAIAGSAQGQQLQIQQLQMVDFDSGHLYMTVTTNPETMPVFFTPDGSLVASFDPLKTADLGPVLAAVVPGQGNVVRIGIDADSSVYADVPAGPGQILHVVRSPRFPVRQQFKADSTGSLPFDPSAVTAELVEGWIAKAAAHTGKSAGDGFTLVVEQRTTDNAVTVTVVAGGKSVRLNLDGTVLPG